MRLSLFNWQLLLLLSVVLFVCAFQCQQLSIFPFLSSADENYPSSSCPISQPRPGLPVATPRQQHLCAMWSCVLIHTLWHKPSRALYVIWRQVREGKWQRVLGYEVDGGALRKRWYFRLGNRFGISACIKEVDIYFASML